MTFEKPQVKITQTLSEASVPAEPYLPSLLLAPRYDVLEKSQIGVYLGDDPSSYNYAYPERSALSIIDKKYSQLFMQLLTLRYYNSSGYTHTWRKVGSAPNKFRTILGNDLKVKTDAEGLYPHNIIFKDRGVMIGDSVKLSVSGKELTTTITDFESDTSASSIDPAMSDSGNSIVQANSIGAASAGISNSGNIAATSNTGGTYDGDLYQNVVEDTITFSVIQAGGKPQITEVSNDNPGITVALNEIYDFSAQETYTIRIITSGAAGVATYLVTSASGTDNEAVQTTPAIGDPMKALGARGVQYQFGGAGAFTAGEEIVISCAPSTAKLQVTTESGTGQITAKIFPGFGAAMNIGRGVEVTLAVAIQPNLVLGDYWTIVATKQLDVAVPHSQGNFIGPVDINYIVEIIQGGEYGQTVARISSTYTDGGDVAIVKGVGPANAIDTGMYGASLHFEANAQNGLVLGDKFSVQANSAKNTAIYTIQTQNSIPAEADASVVSLPVYGGSNPTPNTAASSGKMAAGNKALELYTKEVFTVSVVTAGTYGVAEIETTSISGLNNDLAPTIIPVTPGISINLAGTGVNISFAGANTFELTDSWSIDVTKPNLSIELGIKKGEVNIPRMRVEDATQTAWVSDTNNITINPAIRLYDPTWSGVDALLISEGTLAITYRALHVIGSEDIITVQNLSEAISKLGSDHKDNPATRGARFALDNSGSRPINVAYPSEDTIKGWSSLIEKLEARNSSEVYRIALMTFDDGVINILIPHINKMSGRNKWRMAYISREIPEVFDVIGTSTGTTFTATVIEDASNPGTFSIMKSLNANFELARVGDKVVYLGGEYLVKTIKTPSEIEIDPPFTSPQSVEATVYVYHVPSASEKAEMYAFYGKSYKSRRVVLVAPDNFEGYGESHPMYYGAACIVGLLNSLYPHQGISTYALSGMSSSPDSLFVYTDGDMDVMANGGCTVIAQDNLGTPPYIRHQVTTSVEFLKNRERSLNENLDSISYGMLGLFSPYIGRYNLHPGIIDQLQTNLEGYLYRLTEDKGGQAGPQILGYKIIYLRMAKSSEDTLEVKITVDLPAPFNRAEIEIVA